MKADASGTTTEQARARMGWKTATQARIAGADPERRCSTCRSRFWKEWVRGDGALGISAYCGHIKAGGVAGHATRESATCDFWERKA